MAGQEIILRGEAQRKFAISFLERLKIDPERPFVLSIEPYKKKRTLSQLALLWVRHNEVAQAVADYTGYSAEDVHEILKAKFLKPRIVEIGDTLVERYSTKGLTVQDMTEFMQKIESWAQTELGLLLAQPEDRRVA
jgi:hypothetical protein